MIHIIKLQKTSLRFLIYTKQYVVSLDLIIHLPFHAIVYKSFALYQCHLVWYNLLIFKGLIGQKSYVMVTNYTLYDWDHILWNCIIQKVPPYKEFFSLYLFSRLWFYKGSKKALPSLKYLSEKLLFVMNTKCQLMDDVLDRKNELKITSLISRVLTW